MVGGTTRRKARTDGFADVLPIQFEAHIECEGYDEVYRDGRRVAVHILPERTAQG